MSIEALRAALEALPEPAACEGSLTLAEPIAIALPDGDLSGPSDRTFVEWLVAHGEPAPFGHEGETRVDPTVRAATRLRARGDVRVGGFEPATILGEIEAALSPGMHLDAKLTDVVLYQAGGHFRSHKDTPTTPALIGTLVVGLPVHHVGGALRIDDDGLVRVVDWSGPVNAQTVRWVAMFSDAVHEVRPVESGARVTLVYELTASGRPRADAAHEARMAVVREAVRALEIPAWGPVMIACTRHVILDQDELHEPIAVLRGLDRELADLLRARGLHVRIRGCLVVRANHHWDDAETKRFTTVAQEIHFARLARPLPEEDVAQLLHCVTFIDEAWGDGGGYDDGESSSLAPYLAAQVPIEGWIVRDSAAATFLRELDFSEDGYIGNGAVESYLYSLACLEVT